MLVTKIIGMSLVASFSFSRLHTVRPSMSGMIMSSRTRSGDWLTAASMAR